jgi:S1-C subfamily serine protease
VTIDRQKIAEAAQRYASKNQFDSAIAEYQRVLQVEPGSVAEDAELRENDIIESINRVPVTSTDEFKEKLERLSPGAPIVLQVYRESLAPIPRIFLSFDRP